MSSHRLTGGWLTEWTPEDEGFWRRSGRRTARRNLVFSIFAEHLGFSVWLIWSVLAVSLPAAGHELTADQLFWIVALPNLVGAAMRIPYTMAVTRFGGRNWTVVSALALVVPLGLLVWCAGRPGTPYWMFLVAAATAGLGGGNFASSMANISYFYPERHKGAALGINAAGGNLGVASVQLLVPLAIAAGLGVVGVGAVGIAVVVVAGACAWLFMDNLAAARSSTAQQLSALRNKHTWVMSFLYIGTFGSFIGYSAAFPLLLNTQFTGVSGQSLAFLGPLVGSLSRPVGGWLSDRVGGARVTAATFLVMAAATATVALSLAVGSFWLFLSSFLILFVTSGVGNGSTYRMIPAIFRAEAARAAGGAAPDEPALARARAQAAAVIGLAGAVGALGGFLIPRGFGMSIARTGSINAALMIFLAGYGVCLGVTWWYYLRRVLLARSPSLALANV